MPIDLGYRLGKCPLIRRHDECESLRRVRRGEGAGTHNDGAKGRDPVLIRQGDARDIGLDCRLAFTLAAVAGALNAAVFHAVGFFSANMTGNVSALSSLMAMGEWQHGLGYLTIVFAFIAGATVSTLTISAGLRRGVVTIYVRVVIAEAVLLALLGLTRMTLDHANGIPLLILGLSFLMGLQNAIVTHISNARIRTTHVSGMSTDIGIGIARMIDILRGQLDPGELRQVETKLRLHLGTVAFFLVGGVLGVLFWRVAGNLVFEAAAIPLAWVALSSLLHHRSTVTA